MKNIKALCSINLVIALCILIIRVLALWAAERESSHHAGKKKLNLSCERTFSEFEKEESSFIQQQFKTPVRAPSYECERCFIIIILTRLYSLLKYNLSRKT